MIQELAQQEGLEAPITGMPQERTTVEVREASTPHDLSRNSPSSDSQLGKRILTYWMFPFVITDILMVWFAESTGVAQVEDPGPALAQKIEQFKLRPGNPMPQGLLLLLLQWRLL